MTIFELIWFKPPKTKKLSNKKKDFIEDIKYYLDSIDTHDNIYNNKFDSFK